MNPPGGPDWVWWLTAAVLGAAAVGLGAWSLLWDRSRRGGRVRLRCPKCWYDVAGVPRGVDERGREGLRCPECGRFTRREKGLRRTRRRWGWAVVAGVLGIMAFGAVVVQRANQVGWMGVAPTTLVIAMLPRAGEELAIDPATGRRAESPWSAEMWQRVQDGDLRGWQWRWALSRTRVVQVRHRLPEGEPALVRVVRPKWIGSALRMRVQIEDEPVAPIWAEILTPLQAP
ncbi:MAG: hypothetical protein KIS87_10140, partial [Phycisphaeraceae bacterium]|nr:hypothetical protein [Phycisphaeraceae bacterium]